jgi:hypothetical protein
MHKSAFGRKVDVRSALLEVSFLTLSGHMTSRQLCSKSAFGDT